MVTDMECMECASLAEGAGVRRALTFEYDLRDSLLGGVRKRQRSVLHAQPRCDLAGFSMKSHGRTSTRQARHFAILPAHAMAPARAQSLHRRFFRGEACGIALGAVDLGITVADFARCIDAMQKAIAKARDRL